MGRKKLEYWQLKNRTWLYQKYIEERLTQQEVGDIVGCCRTIVRHALIKKNISIRSPSEAHKNPSKKTREKMSKSHKGEKHSMYGKHHSEKTKEKISHSLMGNIPWNKGKKNVYSEETLKVMTELRHRQKIPTHHTSPERKFEEICEKYNLPFRYVGDGQLWIGKEHLNPDFIENNGKKIIVEIFGDYWHSPLINPNLPERATFKYRKECYKKHGFKAYFLWESDLKRPDAEQFVLYTLGMKNV